MDAIDIRQIESQHANDSFSIEAEDLMIERVFYHLLQHRHDEIGFYVDLGACDPIRASNTHRLYRRGWRGINVEANPAAIPRFKAMRERDTTLNVAIGPDGEVGNYYAFSEPLVNGFLEQWVIDIILSRGQEMLSCTPVPFVSVNKILDEHVPPGVSIDLLNIDIERMELAILSDWDFSRWSPKVIAIEIHGPADVLDFADMPVVKLLRERGYTFVSRLWHTSIFAKVEKYPE